MKEEPMSRLPLLLALIVVCVTTGCMVSEQTGQGNEELAFVFDTEFNRILVFARSAFLVVLGVWTLNASRRKIGPVSFGVIFLLAAAAFFIRDYPTLKNYRVEVLREGLYMNIPPDAERNIPWDTIEEMYVEGVGQQAGGDAVQQMLNLPEWHSMELTLTSGEKILVNLELLSLEQRQILWKAIMRSGGMVEIG